MTLAIERLQQRAAKLLPVIDQRWREHAECTQISPAEVDFFSNVAEERYRARAICYSRCQVRQQCLSYALNTLQINGIWGACDEYELRRTLGVNAKGEPTQRARRPRCPYCLNRDLSVGTDRVTCDKCGLSWPIVR